MFLQNSHPELHQDEKLISLLLEVKGGAYVVLLFVIKLTKSHVTKKVQLFPLP
jgi:hypothetical protein